jgi:alpha-D-ribose 1-methylphosphonate 5-triphosphate synthase subunit PhnG
MAIPIHGVHLRNHLFAQLSLPMQIWVRQQAQQIVRSWRFGRWEEMQLDEAIRLKLSQTSLPAGATLAAVTTTLRFLTLSECITRMGDSSGTVGEAYVGLQNMVQSQQAALLQNLLQSQQALSNISKELQNTAMAVIRRIGG